MQLEQSEGTREWDLGPQRPPAARPDKVLESIPSMTQSPSLEVWMLQHVSVSHVETLKTFLSFKTICQTVIRKYFQDMGLKETFIFKTITSRCVLQCVL